MKEDSVVYLSTKKKKDFDRQKTIVENFCKYKFSIQGIFHDYRLSGKAPDKRDSYREMMEFCTQKEVENIIMFSLPDFSRNPHHGLKELKILTENGFAVYWANKDFIGFRGESIYRKEAVLDFINYMDHYTNSMRKTGAKTNKPGQVLQIGRPKALDSGQKEALITVRRAGTSISRICRMFNVSRSTVSKILADYPELKGEWKGNKPS
jgi:DNA invertase Pin-like site-specific DNA recombinase